MAKSCPSCDRPIVIPSFQLWDGRCPHCSRPLTANTIAEDQSRTPATDEDIASYLHYVKDLSEIRNWNVQTRKTTPLLLLANLLLAIGVALGGVDISFAAFSWLTMFIACVAFFGWRKALHCPRCDGQFNYQRLHDIFQPTPAGDQCPHCGLRALSQNDIRQWEVSRAHGSLANIRQLAPPRKDGHAA